MEEPQEKFYRCHLQNLVTSMDQTIVIDKSGYDNRNNLTEMIWIEKSDLWSIPKDIFEKFPNLGYLFLFQTNLQILDGSEFENSKHLKSLRISTSNQPFVNSTTFSKLSSLEYLGIVHSEVQKIDVDAFEGLVNLKGLYLYDNLLGNLDEKIFEPLMNLEELFLNNNRLQNISENVFTNNYKLKILMLNGNRISKIGSNAFSDKNVLEFVSLEGNECSSSTYNLTEDVSAFETMIDQLEKCFVDNNSYKEYDSDTIDDPLVLESTENSSANPNKFNEELYEYVIPTCMGALVIMIILLTIFAVYSYTSIIKRIFVIMDDVEQFPSNASSIGSGISLPEKIVVQ